MAPPPSSTLPFPLGRTPPRTSSSSRAAAAPSLDSLPGNANARRTTSSVPSTLLGKASGLVLGSGTSRARPPSAHPRIPSSTAVLARRDPAQSPSTRALIGTNDDAAPLVNTAAARAASTDPSPAALVRSGKKPKAPRTEKQLAALASGRGRVAPPAPPRRALAAVDLEPTPRPHVAPVEQLGIELGGPRRHEDERDWAQYKVALREGRTGDIVKIGPKLWAVAPWDPERCVHPITRHWAHLRELEGRPPHCDCGGQGGECVHVQLFQHDRQSFDRDSDIDRDVPLREPDVVLVLRHMCGHHLIFSLTKSTAASTNKRVCVIQRRDQSWSCSGPSCSGARGKGCPHIVRAQAHAVELGDLRPEDIDLVANAAREALDAQHYGDEAPDDLTRDDSAISFRHRAPPPSSSLAAFARARLPRDIPHCPPVAIADAAIAVHPSARDPPALLELDGAARCDKCGRTWEGPALAALLSTRPRMQLAAVVYMEAWGKQVQLEYVACEEEGCNKGRIGPDLLESGLFNLDNVRIFARELLDEFTASATASETPFHAFWTVKKASYLNRDSIKFVDVAYFRRAWYAYACSTRLSSGMTCPKCGPCPEIVIADGHVTATRKKAATGRLDPPTRTSAASHVAKSVKYVEMRTITRATMGMRDAVKAKNLRSLLGKEISTQVALEPFSPALQAEVASMRTSTSTTPFAGALADLLDAFTALPDGDCRSSLKTCLRQICSEDMVLQVLPPCSYPLLQAFLDSATESFPSDPLQQLVPFLYDVTLSYSLSSQPFPPALRKFLPHLLERARALLATLIEHAPDVIARLPSVSLDPDDVFTTGVLAAGPKLRERSVYPKVDTKNGPDGHSGDLNCRKFYDQYGQSSLAGGICGLWCPHGICVMYHTMPSAEGRNDVFAALLSYWPVAPKIVVYDYACQLAQYCMLREPTFFQNTRFYIDEFHGRGHTKCSSACRIEGAMRADLALREVNTSAAECAHSTLVRIRKSVRYMTEAHGIILMWTAIQLWNRQKLRGMLVEKSKKRSWPRS